MARCSYTHTLSRFLGGDSVTVNFFELLGRRGWPRLRGLVVKAVLRNVVERSITANAGKRMREVDPGAN